MADVFISYSHKDSDYAQRLADELKRRQVDVWIDQRLDYGDQWPRVIQENLAACRVFIVLMSTHALNSTWVQNEVTYAQNHNKPIFPLLLEGNIWLSTASFQYVDVRTGELPPERFFERLNRQMRESSTGPRPGQPVASVPKPRPPNPPARRPRWGLYIAAPIILCIAVSGFVFLAWLLQQNGSPSPTGSPVTDVVQTEPPPTVAPTITSTPTPIYNTGVITFISGDDTNQALYTLDPDGSQRPLLEEPGLQELQVLSISPPSNDPSAPRYVVVRYVKDSEVYVVVINLRDASSTTVAQGLYGVEAAYVEDGRLLVQTLDADNNTVTYSLYDADGSNPTTIYTTLMEYPTPEPTASPVATP